MINYINFTYFYSMCYDGLNKYWKIVIFCIPKDLLWHGGREAVFPLTGDV